MDPGPLKTALQQCSEKPLKKTNFSIGHRGAALQFSEYTQDSNEAAARMGAGIVECDVTFMKDKELVYRHSQYAANAHAAGLDIITWIVERSGLLTDGGGFYYQTVSPVIRKPGDMMKALDVLAQDVRILGIFSDWPATVTYYANCLGLE